MQSNLRWEKPIFSNLYRLYKHGEQIGQLKENPFSQTATAQLNGEHYSFKTKGFFKGRTEIMDGSESKVVGEINYSGWMTKATITIGDQVILWKYDNAWNTEWSVYDEKGINIKNKGSFSSGELQANTDDALLFLCGLYITNFYWQTCIALIIILFIPILLNN